MARKTKYARKKPRSRKRKVTRVRRVVRRVHVKRKKKRTASSSVAAHKKAIKKIANSQLKEALFLRDKATNRKQHIAAQLKVDQARATLRKVST